MPMDAPATLSDDEVFAVSAFVLYLNRSSARRPARCGQLAPIRMPNRDGFIGIDAELPASPQVCPDADGRSICLALTLR